jgi:hypothetical protein
MSDDDPKSDHPPAGRGLAETARELTRAVGALGNAGEGNVANLECRLADLQHRFLSSQAASLADIEARLDTIRFLVADLGPRGFLLDLVEATLNDVRAMRSRADRSME